MYNILKWLLYMNLDDNKQISTEFELRREILGQMGLSFVFMRHSLHDEPLALYPILVKFNRRVSQIPAPLAACFAN